MKKQFLLQLVLGIALQAGNSYADPVRVDNAWVRATVPGQTVAGAYMELHASDATRVIEARSPRAPRVEMHEMRMDGQVMRMRPVKALNLGRGDVVTLKPGGVHLMLVNLATPLRVGEHVPLELIVERRGKRERVAVVATVRGFAGSPAH